MQSTHAPASQKGVAGSHSFEGPGPSVHWGPPVLLLSPVDPVEVPELVVVVAGPVSVVELLGSEELVASISTQRPDAHTSGASQPSAGHKQFRVPGTHEPVSALDSSVP